MDPVITVYVLTWAKHRAEEAMAILLPCFVRWSFRSPGDVLMVSHYLGTPMQSGLPFRLRLAAGVTGLYLKFNADVLRAEEDD
jgi:hypothetical protein